MRSLCAAPAVCPRTHTAPPPHAPHPSARAHLEGQPVPHLLLAQLGGDGEALEVAGQQRGDLARRGSEASTRKWGEMGGFIEKEEIPGMLAEGGRLGAGTAALGRPRGAGRREGGRTAWRALCAATASQHLPSLPASADPQPPCAAPPAACAQRKTPAAGDAPATLPHLRHIPPLHLPQARRLRHVWQLVQLEGARHGHARRQPAAKAGAAAGLGSVRAGRRAQVEGGGGRAERSAGWPHSSRAHGV